MVSWWAWVLVLGSLGVLLALDLATGRVRARRALRAALLTSAAWIACSVLFGVVVAAWQGRDAATQYFAGYLLEKALSIDNMFVFAVIFTSLGVPRELQHRVLHYGVVGALVLRAGLIAGGAALIDRFSWTVYAFGTILLVAGARMFRGAHVRPQRNVVLKAVGRLVPIRPELDGTRFMTTENGRRVGTGLLMALVTIETTDLVFATDSIPAIFGITRDFFIVFTSNAFAVLGLRSLYFLLAEAMDRFVHLTKGLALLLVLIGVKMLASDVVEIPVAAMLGTIVVVIGVSVWASVRSTRRDPVTGGTER